MPDRRATEPATDARRAVEFAARASYGRLVAVLASRTRDVAAAEDALGDAFAAALAQWPCDGVPANPEGWLVATAKRRLTDAHRRAQTRESSADALAHESASSVQQLNGDDTFPDRRLELLFACAHPAVDAGVHTPLMLQAVLGFDAADIASAFLVPPSAMAQRLVRAKRKIRDAGIPFTVPGAEELAPRLDAVLQAVYAAFTAGWDAVAGSDPQQGDARADLADEAIWLGRLLAERMAAEPEVRGLLALMLYCHARRDARSTADGSYVPLDEQDTARWSRQMIGEAESQLREAAALERPGRFQLEAAIQSAHVAPAFDRPRDWTAIVSLYDALLVHAPTVGAMVGRAAAIAEAFGPAIGLAASKAIDASVTREYQPWWALQAHLLARAGRTADARSAFERAAGLATAPGVRAFLLARRDSLS